MNSLYLDEQIKFDQENPEREEYRKNDALFNGFLEKCKKQVPKEDARSIEALLDQYTTETWKIRKSFNEFHTFFLKEVPFAVVLAHWVKGVSADKMWRGKYVKGMSELIEKKVLPLIDDQGRNMTLDKFRLYGHQNIIENIRCVREWTPFEKEELVQCYLQFSHSLARYTFDFVPAGFDPDRHRSANRVVRYESFFDFIQHLSVRDALIAKVLYFGAPSIDETFTLKTSAIDSKNSSIQFKDQAVAFPKHLVQDIVLHINEKKQKLDLIFTNVRGAAVERAHLNQSFTRACERMPRSIKITPGGLLKLKEVTNEEIQESEFLY